MTGKHSRRYRALDGDMQTPVQLYDHPLICNDCGANDQRGKVPGFVAPITHAGESRIYCSGCAARRGTAYLFDPRAWREIERERADESS